MSSRMYVLFHSGMIEQGGERRESGHHVRLRTICHRRRWAQRRRGIAACATFVYSTSCWVVTPFCLALVYIMPASQSCGTLTSSTVIFLRYASRPLTRSGSPCSCTPQRRLAHRGHRAASSSRPCSSPLVAPARPLDSGRTLIGLVTGGMGFREGRGRSRYPTECRGSILG